MTKLDTLEPEFRDKVKRFMAEAKKRHGWTLGVVFGRRTMAEQDALYAQGRTAPGKVCTRARAGSSPHNFGLAVDLVPMKGKTEWWDAPDDVWHVLADLAREFGLVAGYYFKTIFDADHFEDPDWKKAQAAWLNGKLKVAL